MIFQKCYFFPCKSPTQSSTCSSLLWKISLGVSLGRKKKKKTKHKNTKKLKAAVDVENKDWLTCEEETRVLKRNEKQKPSDARATQGWAGAEHSAVWQETALFQEVARNIPEGATVCIIPSAKLCGANHWAASLHTACRWLPVLCTHGNISQAASL